MCVCVCIMCVYICLNTSILQKRFVTPIKVVPYN